MMKRFKKILALTLVCTILAIGMPQAFANEVLYEKYSIFDLDLTAIDNYIVLRLYDEEVYNVFVNYALLKNAQVQGIYSQMAEELTGDESEEEVLALFEELTFKEAIYSINNGAPAEELIKTAPEALKALGVDVEALNESKDKAAVMEALKGKTFADLEAFAKGVKNAMSGSAVESSLPNDAKFADITDEKIKEAAEYLAKEGIVSGKSETEFCPADNVKREEFAKTLVLALGILDEKAETEFTDTLKDAWYYGYVASAANKGIINGYGDTFGVGDYITREDVAAICYRAFSEKLAKAENDVTFADNDEISDYALEAVKAISKAGAMENLNENKFAPKEYATRAQIARLIYTLIKDNGKGE